MLNNEFRDWGHPFIYDEATHRGAVEEAGFVDVVPCAPGQSGEEALRGIECHGRVVRNEEMNSFETMVLEARKPS